MELPDNIQEIILAHLVGGITPEQEMKLRAWLDVNVQNRKEYEKFCSMWYAARWGGKRERVNRATSWERISQDCQKRKRLRVLTGIAVAASVVLIIGILGKYYPEDKVLQIVNKESIWDKAEVTLILSSGDSLKVKEMGEMEIQESGIVIRTDSAKIEYLKNEMEELKEVAYNELIVPKSGEFRLRLADGSLIIMNSESRLRYPVEFSRDQREVYLEGEACFEIAKDTMKSFVVHTIHADVQVLGTLFNISAYEGEESTEVTLVNGKVQVNTGGKNKRLEPGEQLILGNETANIEIRKVEALNYIAWTHGLFRFDAMPLKQLMMRLERWYDISCEFKDKALENIRFTGGFHRNDDIHFIINMIEEITNVTFKIEGNKVIIDKK